MSRLIFFVVVVVAVYLLLKSYRRRTIGQDASAGTESRRAEDMVRCLYCGVHLPKSESIVADGKFYCCEAHRQAHQPPPPDRDAG